MRLIDEVIVVLFARLFSIVTKHSFIMFADGHLQKLLLTTCRDVAVVVVVVEVVADGGALPVMIDFDLMT